MYSSPMATSFADQNQRLSLQTFIDLANIHDDGLLYSPPSDYKNIFEI